MDGPFPMTAGDIPEVNRVFSEAFTDRYHRDGLVGVRVPNLSQAVWRYAIADADGGAMLWRSAQGRVAAFNVAHHSGAEGWMGPLAVATAFQGAGSGKTIVRTAVEWLKNRGARVIGLETMPRTMDNIGFYSSMGFDPGPLTITVSIDAQPSERPLLHFSRLSASDQDAYLGECRKLVDSMIGGYDFQREILLTQDLHVGETVLLVNRHRLLGYAVCHSAPLVEGRARDEIRVLKLVCASSEHTPQLLHGIADLARRSGARRVSVRAQGNYLHCYRTLISMGGRVRWTDLRMTAPGFPEQHAGDGVVLSNWEI
jgi:GNAT superfamily N-acetyltransferase